MKKFYRYRLLSFLLSGLLIMCSVAVPEIAAQIDSADTISPTVSFVDDTADYVDGTVLVTMASPKKTALAKEGEVSFDEKIRVDESYQLGDASHLGSNEEQKDFLSDKTIYVSEVTSDTYSTTELIHKLENTAYVVSVEPDYIQHLTDTSDPLEDQQWYLDGQGDFAGTTSGIAYSSTKEKTKSSEPVIAVIDTGIDCSHEDLAPRMWENTSTLLGDLGAHGYDFVENSSFVDDTTGHGTHCDGNIAAAANNQKGITGISDAKLMALKIFNDDGETSNSSVVSAFSYILQAKTNGVNITAVNCSWGGGTSSQAMAELVRSIGKAGTLFVFSAGNDSSNHDTEPTSCPYDLYGSFRSSSSHDTESYSDNQNYMVIVGASDLNDAPASYSDYGSADVDLFAPGDRIISTYIEDTYFPGTYDADKEATLTSNFLAFDTSDELNKLYLGSELGLTSEYTATLAYTGTDYRESQTSGSLLWSVDTDSGSPHGENICNLYWDVNDQDLDVEKDYYVSFLLGVSESSGIFSWDHVVRHSSGVYGSSSNRFYKTEDGHLYFKITGLSFGSSVSGIHDYILDEVGISTANPDTTLFGQYDLMSGTSMAAPMVSGAVGLLTEIYPSDTLNNRKSRLLSCIRTSNTTTGKCKTNGVLDLSKMDSYTPSSDPTTEEPPSTNSSNVQNPPGANISNTSNNTSGTTATTTKVTKVTIKKAKTTLKAGKKLKLKAVITPSSATNKKVKWSSSKKKWATVSQKGVVRAKKKGGGHTVRITARATDGSGKKAVCRIKIKK